MTQVINSSPTCVTVSMSKVRWNRLLELEKAYKTAKTVYKAMAQCETAPTMTVKEAEQLIMSL